MNFGFFLCRVVLGADSYLSFLLALFPDCEMDSNSVQVQREANQATEV